MPTPDHTGETRPFPVLMAYCPACGKRDSLVRGFQGRVFCTNNDCPHPESVSMLLNDPEVANHIVVITARWEGGMKVPHWILQHPVVERIDPHRLGCALGRELDKYRLKYPRLPDGTYRLTVSPRRHDWHLTEIVVRSGAARLEA